MGMILKDKLRELMVGYPTMGDKYNVTGAFLAGTAPVQFGDLVKFSSTDGLYEAITDTVTLADIAGFVLATNVKLAEIDNTTVLTKPGEAFNLAIGGNTFMAIKLDADADKDYIKPNSAVKVILATGKCTTSDVVAGTETLPGVVFTGLYEEQGTDLVAEILIK